MKKTNKQTSNKSNQTNKIIQHHQRLLILPVKLELTYLLPNSVARFVFSVAHNKNKLMCHIHCNLELTQIKLDLQVEILFMK